MWIDLFPLTVFIVNVGFSVVHAACSTGYTSVGSHCYKLLTSSPMTWTSAVANCRSASATLPIIRSVTERDLFNNFRTDNGYTWLEAKELENINPFEASWLSDWEPNSPNGVNNECLALNSAGQFVDQHCSLVYPVYCTQRACPSDYLLQGRFCYRSMNSPNDYWTARPVCTAENAQLPLFHNYENFQDVTAWRCKRFKLQGVNAGATTSSTCCTEEQHTWSEEDEEQIRQHVETALNGYLGNSVKKIFDGRSAKSDEDRLNLHDDALKNPMDQFYLATRHFHEGLVEKYINYLKCETTTMGTSHEAFTRETMVELYDLYQANARSQLLHIGITDENQLVDMKNVVDQAFQNVDKINASKLPWYEPILVVWRMIKGVFNVIGGVVYCIGDQLQILKKWVFG